jgi:precorrin-6B methylase 2
MRYVIHARDGAGRIVLKRDTIEAATKKAEEMKSLGWFDVEIIEQSIEKSKAA